MRVQVVSLVALSLVVLSSIVPAKAIPDKLAKISVSTSLPFEASNALDVSQVTRTVKCNDKEVTDLTQIECQGNFEIEEQKGDNYVTVQCVGRARLLDRDQKNSVSCDGKFFITHIYVREVNYKIQVHSRTQKCFDEYRMQKFTEGDELMNETCVGTLGIEDKWEYQTKYEDHTHCLLECDGVEVEQKCLGVWSDFCKSTSGAVDKVTCEGTFKGSEGRSCWGGYTHFVSNTVDTVTKTCAGTYRLVNKFTHDLREQFENCLGCYSVISKKIGSKPDELPVECPKSN